MANYFTREERTIFTEKGLSLWSTTALKSIIALEFHKSGMTSIRLKGKEKDSSLKSYKSIPPTNFTNTKKLISSAKSFRTL